LLKLGLQFVNSCFDKSQRYFEDALLIANQIKAYNLVEEVQRVRDITVAEK
jgi:hypothetical protein